MQEKIVLTRQGVVELTSRVQRLDEEILPGLREMLHGPDRDGRDDIAFELAAEERIRVIAVLRAAEVWENLPDDPHVVEIGDWVELEEEDGTRETFRIVHPVEAPLDSVRISSESPLGALLLGKRDGDDVELLTRLSLPVRYKILASSRKG